MIVRHVHLILAVHLVYIVTAQNARSYDTSDWVPITQKTNDEGSPKKATGRVLNLDAPAKNFFPEDDYSYRKHRPLASPNSKKRDRYNLPKYEDNTYKFELPNNLKQKGNPQIQYFSNQEVKLSNYEQPPPLDQYRSPSMPHQSQRNVPDTRERVPAPNAASIYDKYTLPFNNPGLFNRELLSAIPYQQNTGNVGDIQNSQQLRQIGDVPTATPTVEKEAVELVYVPLEHLKPNQPITQDSQAVYKQAEPPRYNDKIASNNNANQIEAIQHDFLEQALRATQLQQQFENGQPIQLQSFSTTTAKPMKKRKAHQPPLAVYMEGQQPADIEDVLGILKGAKTISVQDSVQPNSPQIFIGPTSLDAPEGYTKFPLPYLNNVNGNRIEKQIENLPFFVAPLSFKTPPGYSKIPLPAPHVGSVVISNKEDPHEQKRSTPAYDIIKSVTASPTDDNNNLTPQPYRSQDYYNQGPLFSSTQPQALQFNANANNKELSLPSGYYQPSSNAQYDFPQVFDRQKYNFQNPSFDYSFGQDNIKTTQSGTDQYGSNNQRFTTPSYQDLHIPSRTTFSQDAKTSSLDSSREQPSTAEQDYKSYETPYYSNDQKIRNSNSDPSSQSISNTGYEKYNDSPERFTANITPNVVPEQEKKIESLDVNPLELAINEFELHQINSQLEEKPRIKNQYDYDSDPQTNQRDQGRHRTRQRPQTTTEESQYKFDPELHRFSSTPASILRDTNIETTVRPISSKSRRRGRPTRPTTTTPAPTEKETYTVLEEFSIQPKPPQYPDIPQNSDSSRYSETPRREETFGIQYASGNEENPASVYTLRTTTPSYITAAATGGTRNKPFQSTYEHDKTIIEDIPAKVHKLRVNENSQVYDAPVYNGNIPVYNENLQSQNQELQYKQNTRDDNPRGGYQDSSHSPQYDVQPNVEPLVYNRGQYQENQKELNVQVIPEVNSDSDINYEDPSIRSLLVPNLLVPRAPEIGYTAPEYLPTTEPVPITTPSTTTTTTTTTERYVESTTQSRTRGRPRGGSRYNVPTTRRTPTRRRPSHTQRTTTERSSYSTETGDSQRISTRQRFRTRGRTTPINNGSERLPTTGNDVHNVPSSEPRQYNKHLEENANSPPIVTAGPYVEDISERQQAKTSSQLSPQLFHENTATTSRPVADIHIKHPVQNEVRAQSDNVYKAEENPRESIRIRGRIRGRPRPVSTTTEAITTRKPTRPAQKEEGEDEFFGFFRQPNFSPPPVYQSEPVSSTSRPGVHYESTPSQPRDDVRLQYDNTREVYSTTPRFVGEIVPKYTTSRENERADFETPKPRIRARIRAPQRQTSPITSAASTETSTRYSSALRSRGRSHYKVPENLRKEKEDDVEGGNYPAEFFQNKQQFTTRSPVFQITVMPEDDEEDDQVPHHSLYRPNILARPEEWHEASLYDAGDEGKDNLLSDSSTNENAQTTTDQPIALPVKADTEDTISSSSYESTYREAAEEMKKIFEDISNKYEGVKVTTKKPITNERKRGKWKLVKLRPVDRLEVAESQNYYSVLNSFDEIKKIDASNQISNHDKSPTEFSESQDYYSVLNSYDDLRKINASEPVTENEQVRTDSIVETTHSIYEEKTNVENTDPTTTAQPAEPITETFGDHTNTEEPLQETIYTTETSQLTKTTTTEDNGFFSSLYNMLGASGSEKVWGETTPSPDASDDDTETPTTTVLTPNFPEEMTEAATATQNVTEASSEATTGEDSTTPGPAQKMSPFQVEPWEMRAVKTSTSTEVSHETEICYKGRCIKAADRKKRL